MKIPDVKSGWRRIVMIRHGETIANKEAKLQGSLVDSELTEKGEKQANLISEFMKRFDIDHVVTSNLKRSMQTAEKIGDFEFHNFADFNEMDYGVWDGSSLADVFPDIKNISKKWSKGEFAACPGGESPVHVLDRAKRGLDRLLSFKKQRDNGVIVIVSHNFVIKILLSQFVYGHLRNLQQIQQNNGSINIFDVENESGKVEVHVINYCEHLARL